METNFTDVISYITLHATSEEARRINKAATERVKLLGKMEGSLMASLLKPGDKVTLSGLSPKYLNGMTATVKEAAQGRETKVTVVLDDEHRATRYGTRPVKVPAQCLTKI
jgi:hypothetical protein